jgi:predicted dehydrogenase
MTRALRFGLVGTGYWARTAHAPALAASAASATGTAAGRPAGDIEFTTVWGRNAAAAADLAASYQATPHQDFDTFLASVDAVDFAVPPDVQAPLATRAARAGKHLLLEKPIALTTAAADELATAVSQAQVASVVFFTARFQADVRAWLAEVTATGGWAGGQAIWLGTALQPGSPFNTPWRQANGGLWDLAPHVISLLWASLGPVTAVTAEAGSADVTHLILHHTGGASSAATVTLSAPESAAGARLELWGPAGRSAAPVETDQPGAPLRTALAELAANAQAGQLSHPCDVQFGRAVTRVLVSAQRQLDLRRSQAQGWNDA